MRVEVASSLVARLLAEAAASPHVEVCGLLFGEAGSIADALPACNVATNPAVAFEIDPAALFAALRAERAGGQRIAGCYHSHPSGDATPSPRDVAAAEPGGLWLILADGAARLWRARVGGFDAVTIDWR